MTRWRLAAAVGFTGAFNALLWWLFVLNFPPETRVEQARERKQEAQGEAQQRITYYRDWVYDIESAWQATNQRDLRTYKRRTVPAPGCTGPAVEEEWSHDRGKSTEQGSAKESGSDKSGGTHELELRWKTKVEELEKLIATQPAPRKPPRWSVAAGPAWTLSDLSTAAPSGAVVSVGRNLIGPMWIQGQMSRASGETTGALMLGVTF